MSEDPDGTWKSLWFLGAATELHIQLHLLPAVIIEGRAQGQFEAPKILVKTRFFFPSNSMESSECSPWASSGQWATAEAAGGSGDNERPGAGGTSRLSLLSPHRDGGLCLDPGPCLTVLTQEKWPRMACVTDFLVGVSPEWRLGPAGAWDRCRAWPGCHLLGPCGRPTRRLGPRTAAR